MAGTDGGSLLAVSDLHVGFERNREIVRSLAPEHDDDWLIVAGDVGDVHEDIEWALETLAGRFAQVVWVPGNHELWTPPGDRVQLGGAARYDLIVETARSKGVVTPEDAFPLWQGRDAAPVRIAPLFVLYDHSFGARPSETVAETRQRAYDAGVVCTDEFLMRTDPFDSAADWCHSRVAYTRSRLADYDDGVPFVLVNHWPLVSAPTQILRHPLFAQWCGTELTADWHVAYPTAAVVYGHLHVPSTSWHDGVRFEEVSLGYPQEWEPRECPPPLLRHVLVEDVAA